MVPDALEQKLCEPTEKAVAVIAAIMNPLLGITVQWDRTSQIQRSRELGENWSNSVHRQAAAFVIPLTSFNPGTDAADSCSIFYCLLELILSRWPIPPIAQMLSCCLFV